MSPSWLSLLFVLTCTIGCVKSDSSCVDLLPICASLQAVCFESIFQYHWTVLNNLTLQANSSTIPALESSLPLLESSLPLVLGSNPDASTPSGSSDYQTTVSDEDALKNALPLLKESLPLIRESLPLVRESLPLIRQFLDPLSTKTSCQQKATCRSCKECPKLRGTIVSFVESLCPSTCKVCTSAGNTNTTATALAAFFG